MPLRLCSKKDYDKFGFPLIAKVKISKFTT